MILSDQPTNFTSDVLVAISSKSDGSMLNRSIHIHDPQIVLNRERFCEEVGVKYETVVYQKIVYADDETYDQLVEVGENSVTSRISDVQADAVCTTTPGVGLFLPVADCVATVVYDSVQKHLALLHLGRHSTMTNLVTKTVAHFVATGSKPGDLMAWMSPSAKKDTYMLDWFDLADRPEWQGFCKETEGTYYIDLPGYNRQRFIDEGVRAENIYVSEIDTTKNDNYFSHRGGDTVDRIAVLAMMR